MRMIKEMRVAKGMSVAELAKATGYKANSIYAWEKEYTGHISLRAIKAIAAALGTTPLKLLGDTNTEKMQKLENGDKVSGDILGEPLKDCFAYGAIRGECTALSSSGGIRCFDPITGKRCSFYRTVEEHLYEQARARAINEERSKNDV